MQLEHEARVVVEATAEGGREFDAPHVDTARSQEAGAALEQVERAVELERAVLRDRTQLCRRFVGVSRDGEEALDQRAGLAWQRGLGAERGLLEEAIRD